jgi:hypothetical protein
MTSGPDSARSAVRLNRPSAEAALYGPYEMRDAELGGAQRPLDLTVAYAGTRLQFGRPIGSFQAVKHRCADMLVLLEHARSTACHAALGAPRADRAARARSRRTHWHSGRGRRLRRQNCDDTPGTGDYRPRAWLPASG